MAREETPIYLFTGFMDSGKTSLIHETIFENQFVDGARGVVIVCEDGDEEYDKEKFKEVGLEVLFVENKEDFNPAMLQKIEEAFKPELVFIEYNGTWEVSEFLDMDLPKGWVLVQTLATVDATTFEVYLQNMRTMMLEQLTPAEVIIFNRCTPDTNKTKFRANVKSFNRPAQLVYEREDGTIDDEPEELPFDLNADVIEISDADYALWYMDCTDNYKKYDGKTVHFTGLVYNPPGKMKKNFYVPGRFAMTCCADDIQFLGFMCKDENAKNIAHKTWLDFTAKIKVEFLMAYKGEGPVFYPVKVTKTEKPEDELVYFN